MPPHALGLGPYRAVQLFSVSSLAFLFGSTTWASVAVMPSVVVAPISTWAKLSVLKGLILLANAILPPALLSVLASLAYLAYDTRLPSSRRNHLLALSAVLGILGLRVPIAPRNRAMVEIVDKGLRKYDDGREANWRIKELSKFNIGSVILSGFALFATAYEMLPKRDGVPVPVRI